MALQFKIIVNATDIVTMSHLSLKISMGFFYSRPIIGTAEVWSILKADLQVSIKQNKNYH